MNMVGAMPPPYLFINFIVFLQKKMRAQSDGGRALI
jgi:hypothetical protein